MNLTSFPALTASDGRTAPLHPFPGGKGLPTDRRTGSLNRRKSSPGGQSGKSRKAKN